MLHSNQLSQTKLQITSRGKQISPVTEVTWTHFPRLSSQNHGKLQSNYLRFAPGIWLVPLHNNSTQFICCSNSWVFSPWFLSFVLVLTNKKWQVFRLRASSNISASLSSIYHVVCFKAIFLLCDYKTLNQLSALSNEYVNSSHFNGSIHNGELQPCVICILQQC